MEEELRWRVTVDASDIEAKAQRVNQMSQQQLLGMSNQLHAASIATQSSAYAGEMSARGALAQNAYSAAINTMGPATSNAGLTGFYGQPLINPTMHQASGYQYPYGYLDGPSPYDSSIERFNLGKAASGYVKSLGMRGLSAFGSSGLGEAMGLSGAGIYGMGGPYDVPLYKATQTIAERNARMKASLFPAIGDAAAGAGLGMMGMAGMAAAFIPGVGLPVAGAIGAAHLAGTIGFNNIKDSRDAYLDSADYFRDSMAPNFRDDIRGGPSFARSARFVQGMARNVAKDRTTTRDDYQSLMELSTEEGLFQTYNDEQQILKGLENVKKGVRVLNSIGVKMQEIKPYVSQLAAMGINLADDPLTAARMTGTLGFASMSSGVPRNTLMERATAAGSMMAQQGIDSAVGAEVYMRNAGMIGEGIRGGSISFRDLQKYGGREGLTDAVTRGQSSLLRTGIGQMNMASMIVNPMYANQVQNGTAGAGSMMAGLQGLSAEQFLAVQTKQDEFMRGMDPNLVALGGVSAYVDQLAAMSPGGKVNEAVLKLVMEQNGVLDAGALIKSLKMSPKALGGAMETAQLKYEQLRMGQQRTAPNLLTNASGYMQNLAERMWDPYGVSYASGILNKQQSEYDSYLRKLDPGGFSVSAGLGDGGSRLRDTLGRVDMPSDSGVNGLAKDTRNRYMSYAIQRNENAFAFFGGQNQIVKDEVFKADQGRVQQIDRISSVAGGTAEGTIDNKHQGLVMKLRGGLTLSSAEEDQLIAASKAGELTQQQLNILRGSKESYRAFGAFDQVAQSMNQTEGVRQNIVAGLSSNPSAEARRKVLGMSVESKEALIAELSRAQASRDPNEFMRVGVSSALGIDVKTVDDLANLKPEQLEMAGQILGGVTKGTTGVNSYLKALDVTTESLGGQDGLRSLAKQSSKSRSALEKMLGGKLGGSWSLGDSTEVGLVGSALKEGALSKLRDGASPDDLNRLVSDDSAMAALGIDGKGRALLGRAKGNKEEIRKLLAGQINNLKTKNMATIGDNSGLTDLYENVLKGVDNEGVYLGSGFRRGGGISKDDLIGLSTQVGDTQFAMDVESAAFGDYTADKRKSMAQWLGSQGLEDKAFQQIGSLLEGSKEDPRNVQSIFNILNKNKSLQGLGGLGQKLISARGGKLGENDVAALKGLARKTFSDYGNISGGESAIDSFVDKAAQGKLSEQQILQGVVGSAEGLQQGAGTFVGGSGKLSDRVLDPQLTGELRKAFQGNVELIKMAQSITSKIETLPDIGKASADELKKAFGVTSTSNTVVGSIEQLTKSIDSLRTSLKTSPVVVQR